MTDIDSNSNAGKITIENLQDLLIYDDTFLDYFNVFLKLPVFPQPLEYQRLTDSFKILDEGFDSVVSCDSPPPFMASEEELIKRLEWAQKYRLPLFLKTDLFRELKLSKLLIKPLELGLSSSRETFVHGYSKQSNCSSFTTPTPSKYSSLSSKSNSMIQSDDSNNSSTNKSKRNNEKSDYDYMDIDEDNIPYDHYLRPGSRAISLPIQIKFETQLNQDSRNEKTKRLEPDSSRTDKNLSNLSDEFNALKDSRQKSQRFDPLEEDNLFYRIQSAPLNFDAIHFGSINEEVEESLNDEIEALEGRQKISLQRLKEVVIGTHDGMHEFEKFLQNTAGKCLCEFWLDCEHLKDLSAFRTDEENVELRNNLLRNLKDKYKLNLTKSAKEQLNEAMRNPEKLHSIFLQAQYDTLRRLRSYWLPRYLIHQESIVRQFTFSDLLYMRLPTFQSDSYSIQSGVFPKLTLQTSLPYLTNSHEVQSMKWNQLMPLSDKSIVEPSQQKISTRQKSNFSEGIFLRSAFQNRLRFALGLDTASGCPFKNYLQSRNLIQQIRNLEFYQEVHRFKAIYSRNSDRLLRLSQAWSIINKFVLSTGKYFIDVPDNETREIISALKKFKSSVKNEIFDELIEFSIQKLQHEWLLYLKEDVKRFMESSLTQFDHEIPPRSIDEVEVTIEGETIVVRRKHESRQQMTRTKTWDQLSKVEKKLRRAAALELKRITERERHRVLIAIERRIKLQQEEEKRFKTMSYMKFQQSTKVSNDTVILSGDTMVMDANDNESDGMIEDGEISAEPTEIKVEEKVPEMRRVLNNKVLLNLLKKYATDRVETVGKDAFNCVMLLQEIFHYIGIDGFDKQATTKKDGKATQIYKSYLEKGAKRSIPLTEKIRNRVTNEQERPKTPTFREIQNHIYHSLADVFNEFWKYEVTELGVKSDILAKMTEKELQLLAENQLIEASKSGTKGSNTADHTKEDKADLMLALKDASYKPMTLQILYFFNYLLEKGPEDKLNNLEKDLFFYVEVLKLKEICRTTVDEDIAKKKIQCISSTFLDSVYPPTVQINIPNELVQRVNRSVLRQMTSKEINISIFDECQYHCLKNLLPYWAGFQRQWEIPVDTKFNPINKYQRLLERRLKIYNDIPIPKADIVSLPIVPKSNHLTTLSYTMNEGAKWKQPQEAAQEVNNNRPDGTGSESSRSVNQPISKKISRKFSRLSVTQTIS